MAGQVVGDASLAAGSTFGLKLIDEIGAASTAPCPASVTRLNAQLFQRSGP
jgi:hypothetical protein